MSTIYDRIIEQANKHNISRKELAQLLNLKKSPLTDWKNQKSKPTLDQIKKMCEIFATSSDYLLFGKNASLSENETKIIEYYRKMNPDDKKELLIIAKVKADKTKGQPTMSFHLENDNQTSETA